MLFYATGIPEKVIPICALVGLGLGIITTIAKLKCWRGDFYATKIILAVPLYIFWSAAAIAFFMRLPIGNIVLGLLAGFYIGRRGYHAGMRMTVFKKKAQKVSLLTAAITGFASLAIGILAIQSNDLPRMLTSLGIGSLAATDGRLIVLVAVVVPILIAIQYWLTYRTAHWGFRLRTNEV